MRSNPPHLYDFDFTYQNIEDSGEGQITNLDEGTLDRVKSVLAALVGPEDERRPVAVFHSGILYDELKKLLAANLNDAFEAVVHYRKRFGEDHPMTFGAKYVCQQANDIYELICGAAPKPPVPPPPPVCPKCTVPPPPPVCPKCTGPLMLRKWGWFDREDETGAHCDSNWHPEDAEKEPVMTL